MERLEDVIKKYMELGFDVSNIEARLVKQGRNWVLYFWVLDREINQKRKGQVHVTCFFCQ